MKHASAIEATCMATAASRSADGFGKPSRIEPNDHEALAACDQAAFYFVEVVASQLTEPTEPTEQNTSFLGFEAAAAPIFELGSDTDGDEFDLTPSGYIGAPAQEFSQRQTALGDLNAVQ